MRALLWLAALSALAAPALAEQPTVAYTVPMGTPLDSLPGHAMVTTGVGTEADLTLQAR